VLALDPTTAALAPAALVIGLCLMILPLFRPDHPWVRAGALILVVLLAWRYIIWRFTDTVTPLGLDTDAIVSWTFAILEPAPSSPPPSPSASSPARRSAARRRTGTAAGGATARRRGWTS
jgi:hypothetical protein